MFEFTSLPNRIPSHEQADPLSILHSFFHALLQYHCDGSGNAIGFSGTSCNHHESHLLAACSRDLVSGLQIQEQVNQAEKM